MNRLLLGGLVGGVVLFAWGFLLHLVLPLEQAGVKAFPPDSEVVVDCIRFAMREPGVYPFPPLDVDPSSEEEVGAWEEAYRDGPRGVVVIQPGTLDREPEGLWAQEFTRRLSTEFLSGLLGSLLAAFVLVHVRAPYGVRVLVVVVMGLFSWVTTSLPLWNWYGFPPGYTAVALLTQVGGWFLAGLAIARIVRGR